jgi:hypothetical protein
MRTVGGHREFNPEFGEPRWEERHFDADQPIDGLFRRNLAGYAAWVGDAARRGAGTGSRWSDQRTVALMTTATRPIPEQGQLVSLRSGSGWCSTSTPARCRRRHSSRPSAGRSTVTLASVEDDGLGEELQVVWEVEPGARVVEKVALPMAEEFDPPETLDAFLDAVRWGAASSADVKTVQAPFRSGIDIEDYQLAPVVRAVQMPRVNLLIDFLKRERPLRLFRETLPGQGHPQGGSQPAYPRCDNLLICDEAHNCAPSGRGKYATDSMRTQALRELVPHFEHQLFLSATPHNGYPESFSALLELLDNQRFSRGTTPDRKQLDAVMVRRLKSELPPKRRGFFCLRLTFRPSFRHRRDPRLRFTRHPSARSRVVTRRYPKRGWDRASSCIRLTCSARPAFGSGRSRTTERRTSRAWHTRRSDSCKAAFPRVTVARQCAGPVSFPGRPP